MAPIVGVLLVCAALIIGTFALDNPDVYDLGWQYNTCWKDPNSFGSSVFDKGPFTIAGLTVEKCLAYCRNTAAGGPYNYAGLRQGSQCWCSNDPSPDVESYQDEGCTTACPGDSNEPCGGTGFTSMYIYDLNRTPGRPNLDYMGQYWQGCFNHSIMDVAADHYDTYYPSMTVERCYGVCEDYFGGGQHGGYFAWGIGEDQAWCICYRRLNPNKGKIDVSQCDYLCPGDQGEYCGGQDRYDVYARTNFTYSGTTTTYDSVSASLSTSRSRYTSLSLYSSSSSAAESSRSSARSRVSSSQSAAASSRSSARSSVSASQLSASLSRSRARSTVSSSKSSASSSRSSARSTVSASQQSASLSRSLARSSISASRASAQSSLTAASTSRYSARSSHTSSSDSAASSRSSARSAVTSRRRSSASSRTSAQQYVSSSKASAATSRSLANSSRQSSLTAASRSRSSANSSLNSSRSAAASSRSSANSAIASSRSSAASSKASYLSSLASYNSYLSSSRAANPTTLNRVVEVVKRVTVDTSEVDVPMPISVS